MINKEQMQKNLKENILMLRKFKGINSEVAREARLECLNSLGVDTSTFERSSLSSEAVSSNIESFIGTYNIPTGVVGPIALKHEGGTVENIFTLVGTTEGALVASMNRGSAILRASGGFQAIVQKQRMLRAPIFQFENLYEANYFSTWIQEKIEELRVYLKKYSKHSNLIEIKTNLMGKNVDSKFYYTTGDASGQNMTTICTWHACLWIEKEFFKSANFKIKDFVLEGNGASDKKISYASIQGGRGVDVVAECFLSHEILEKKLKVSAKDLLKWFNISYQLTTFDGMLGNNVNVANAIAAMFVTAGQDLACLVESSVGFLQLEPHEKGIYFSLKLPKLVIGTVGGGTGLPQAKAVLQMMDCYGPGKVERFAKLIAGFALGLEISTISAMVSGQFAIAHERLGRNKPVDYLDIKKLDTSFFQNNKIIQKNEKITFIENLTECNGIVMELSSKNTPKAIGFSHWEIFSEGKKENAILKNKATSRETLNCMYLMTGMIDPKLAKYFMMYQESSEFIGCHSRELALCEFFKKNKTVSVPRVYGTYLNEDSETYFILMQYLNTSEMKVMNSENDVHLWDDGLITKAITQVTKLHKDLNEFDIEKFETSKSKETLFEFSEYSIEILRDQYEKRYPGLEDLFNKSLNYLKNNSNKENTLFKVCIHNDFNPRNIAYSNDEKFYFYDWELATSGLPHRDILELYLFCLHSPNLKMSFDEISELHRKLWSDKDILPAQWREGYKEVLSDFIVSRLVFYLLGHQLRHYSFLDQLVRNVINFNQKERIL